MTKVLHKAFSNIKSQTIQEVKSIVNEGFYKKNDSEKMKELLALAGKLSNIYKAPWITDLLILRPLLLILYLAGTMAVTELYTSVNLLLLLFYMSTGTIFNDAVEQKL